MLSAPGRAFVSWTAARSVHRPARVAHAPSPGLASTASAVLSTVKLAAMAPLARPIKATEARASKSKLGSASDVLPEPEAAESRATAVLDHRGRALWCHAPGSRSLRDSYRAAGPTPADRRR